MLKTSSLIRKITLILIALITVACSDPKDKYIALECKENAATSFNLILNKETMTWDAYEPRVTSDLISGTYQEVGDHYYDLNREDIGNVYIDRRTLETNYDWQCEIIDLPDYYLADKENKNKI